MSRHYPELEHCAVCPQNCGVNRYQSSGFCGADHRLKINLAQIHHGEEPVLSGTGGSGTIFLSHCNLRCVFCQNHEISHQGWGNFHSEEECAGLMLQLTQAGAHNINLVSPTHFTPQLIAAIKIARAKGLNIPIVWNSNAYERVDTLKSLAGLVDIYLPDFKYAHAAYSRKYSSAPDYPAVALAAIREMQAQVGPLSVDADGIAKRGVLIRHLVLPGGISGTREVLYQIRDSFGPDAALSLMAQYYPAGGAGKYPELNRALSQCEYEAALETVESLGFTRVFTQELTSSANWTPEFQSQGETIPTTKLHFRGKENHV